MRPPIALAIDASDPCGALGLPAALKTFSALGVYGAGAITAVLDRDLAQFRRALPMSADAVATQVRSALTGLAVDATCVSVLPTVAVAEAVAEVLTEHAGRTGRIVVDPILMTADGTPLVSAEAASVLRDRIVPLADVLTPSLGEAALLVGAPAATTLDEVRAQAESLHALGARVVVMATGRLGGDEAIDIVAHDGGVDILRAERVESRAPLGAGSTFTAAIAAQFARMARLRREDPGHEGGDDLTVIASAREFVASALAHADAWEVASDSTAGGTPLNHLITLAED